MSTITQIALKEEMLLRLFCFISVFILIALCEYIYPRRCLKIKKNIRWFRNVSLAVINSIAVRWFVPFTASAVAIYANQHQFGLFYILPISFSATVIVSILLLDLLIYTQHVIFHHVPLFWQLHKIHHIDQEIDVTTGIRFHPLEMMLSSLIRCAVVLVFGIPFLAIVLFEALLNATSMFSHGNINLPMTIDKYLRLIMVTPDMHRVHHSVIVKETNSNFGFNLSWWDRLFGTYKPQPKQGHTQMNIGLKQYQNINKTGLFKILALAKIPLNKKYDNK